MAESVQSRIDIKVTTDAEKAAIALDKLVDSNENVVVSIDKATRIRERNEAGLVRLAKRLDQEFRAVKEVEGAQKELQRAQDAGLGKTLAFEKAVAGLARRQEELGLSSDGMIGRLSAWSRAANDNRSVVDKHTNSVGLARHELINLSRQFQDIGVSLAGGQSPLTVLFQQGSQIGDVFASSKGGAGAALKEFGAIISGVVLNPITLIAAAAGTAGIAMYRWKDANDALTVSLNGLGRQSGLTLSQINRVAETSAARSGISINSAQGIAGQFLNAGVAGGSIGSTIGLTRGFSRGLGLSLDDAAKELAQALADPAKGADELAKKYGLVSFAQREQIKELAAIGDRSGATAKLLGILGEQIARMKDPTSSWTRLLERAGAGLSDFLTRTGRELSESDGVLNRKLGASGPRSFQDAFADIKRAAEQEKQAQADRDAERAKQLNNLREDSALAIREIEARTFAERAAVAEEKARVTVLRQTHDVTREAIAAESERNRLIAEGNRAADEKLRSTRNESELIGLKPLDRRLKQIEQEGRDFREQFAPKNDNVRPELQPFVSGLDRAKTAADLLAEAFARLSGRVDGRSSPPVFASGASGADAATLIRRFEGFAPTARFDVNAFRAGFGSDTFTRPDGSFGRVTPNTTVSLEDAERDLKRRLREFEAIIARQIGDKAFEGLSPRARAALDSVAFNFGSLPRRILPAVRSGDDAAIADSIRSLADDNGGINRRRRLAEADSILSGPVSRVDRVSRANDAELARQAQQQFRFEPLAEGNREIDRQTALLEARNAVLGKGTAETVEAVMRQELMNDALKNSNIILPEQQAEIDRLAHRYGLLAKATEEAADAQRRLMEEMELVRGIARDSLGTFVQDLRQGKSAGEALEDVLGRIADKLLSFGVDRLVDVLLGQSGMAGGGLFGGFLGSLFRGGFGASSSVGAPIQLPGATLAAGFADGGIMTSHGAIPLHRYASGGIATSPQLALFGEGRGPEAFVPLKNGAIPVALRMAGEGVRSANDNSGAAAQLRIEINNFAAGVKVEPQISEGRVVMIVSHMLKENNARMPAVLASADKRSA